MMLINNDEQLRQFLPNVLATCDGEVSLFDKLQFHLNNAEQWLAENVTGRNFISTVAGAQADDATRALLCQTIAAHAFHVALPSLDLVLTPTGFGIVSNGNIAPASAERVARLSESLLLLRDTLIDQLLSHLCQNASWRETPQATYFSASLFPSLELSQLAGHTSDLWEHYRVLRQQVLSIEYELATKYISEALYARFRQHALQQTLSASELPIVVNLRNIEVELLAGKPLNYVLLKSLVNDIRSNPVDFPEWQSSTTAQLFCQPSFQNKKNSSGYWF